MTSTVPERGGADKLCRVVLRLKDNSVLVIEDLGVNMMEVIDRVADRLHHTVARQLSRLARVERAGIRQSSLLCRGGLSDSSTHRAERPMNTTSHKLFARGRGDRPVAGLGDRRRSGGHAGQALGCRPGAAARIQ